MLSERMHQGRSGENVAWNGSTPLVWDAKHLRMATDAAGVALWSWNVDTDQIAMDERSHALWGVPRTGVSVTFEDLSARIHPEDLDRVRLAFQATREIMGAYDIDFRILEGEETRWISARGQGDDLDIRGRVMFGVFLDVTDRKRAEERQEMLALEMSHRVKNLFSLVGALTSISARSARTVDEMKLDLSQRLVALGRAHDLALSGPDHGPERVVHLDALLSVLLAPYDEQSAPRDRIRLEVPALPVDDSATSALALVVHELATNSIKYGALSSTTGLLHVTGRHDGPTVILVWTERGGPATLAPRGRKGFGSKLLTQALSGQLGGSVAMEWSDTGLRATLEIHAARMRGDRG